MKLLQKVGAIASLAFCALGLFRLFEHGLFLQNQVEGIFELLGAVTLSFGLYLFYLRGRIEALEKRLGDKQ